jgi:hypothetical protein
MSRKENRARIGPCACSPDSRPRPAPTEAGRRTRRGGSWSPADLRRLDGASVIFKGESAAGARAEVRGLRPEAAGEPALSRETAPHQLPHAHRGR